MDAFWIPLEKLPEFLEHKEGVSSAAKTDVELGRALVTNMVTILLHPSNCTVLQELYNSHRSSTETHESPATFFPPENTMALAARKLDVRQQIDLITSQDGIKWTLHFDGLKKRRLLWDDVFIASYINRSDGPISL
ncbi:hypothetical protein CEXT_150691 [Caerostris extrusa]|uniref:Uncharacterized protein n=1 Tax=Caerostris extrusa TaxID=172846 RepID=A0AAV4MR21_CAEEX|nr:hypothetical protein CEXT_150691 [Caerostris extrusa]